MKRRILQLLAVAGCLVTGMLFTTTQTVQVYADEMEQKTEAAQAYGAEELFSQSVASGLSTEEIRYEGVSGDISWCITMDGTLYLEGDGDYVYDGENAIHNRYVPKWADDLYSYSIKKAVVNIKNITSCERLFFFCENLETVNLNGLDFSKVTDMQEMFSGCSSLKAVDLSRFDTSEVTSMYAMFYGCSSLTKLDVTGFDTSKVTDMCGLFHGCSGLLSLDVSKFDTSNTVDMYAMFYGCSGLKTLDVSKFDTSKVYDMHGLFQGCSSLTKLELGDFNTAKAREMGAMFYDCSSLKTLDLSSFDTSTAEDFSEMFRNCSNLTTINVAHFNTAKVMDMNSMFYGCSSLKAIDVTNFNTAKVLYMQDMFCECSKLEKVDVSAFNVSKLRKVYGMFDGCSSLTEMDLYVWNLPDAATTQYMFNNCKSLTRAVLPEKLKGLYRQTFTGCTALESVFVPSTVEEFVTSWVADNVVVECYSGSAAETWAKDNNHSYKIITHTHTYKETASKKATCKEKGYVTYKCTYSGCDASYSKTLQKTDHTAVTDAAVEATCTESGKTEGSHCSVCDTVIVAQETVPAKGHTEVTDKAVEATCTKSGKTKGSHCSVCDKVLVEQKIVPAKGHTEVVDKAVEATCSKTGLTEGSHCSVCNEVLVEQEVIKKKSHSYGEIVTQAAVGRNGSIVNECIMCGKVKSETIICGINTIKLSATKYTYNGKVQKPSVIVEDTKGNKLKEDTDYTVTYASGCKKPGSYTVTVKFEGNYSGSKELTYTINVKKYSSCKISKTTYTYNGKVRKPTVTVKGTDGKKLKKNTDYTVTYSKGCKKPGVYKVTVKFKGNYIGNKAKTFEFTIKPKEVSLSKVTAKSKGFKVNWKKGTEISGYQIQYSTSKKFTKKTTDVVTIKGAKNTSKTISKLKAKKKYYVRIRTYKTVTVNGKSTKLYSAWSNTKKVTTKK